MPLTAHDRVRKELDKAQANVEAAQIKVEKARNRVKRAEPEYKKAKDALAAAEAAAAGETRVLEHVKAHPLLAVDTDDREPQVTIEQAISQAQAEGEADPLHAAVQVEPIEDGFR